jgi:glycoside hydrolase family 97 protein
MLKKLIILTASALLSMSAEAALSRIESPDEKLVVGIDIKNGAVFYNVDYAGKTILEPCPLGLITKFQDFSKGMNLVNQTNTVIDENYTLDRSKKSNIHYNANEWIGEFSNTRGKRLDIVSRVSNNDIAFKYLLYPKMFLCQFDSTVAW